MQAEHFILLLLYQQLLLHQGTVLLILQSDFFGPHPDTFTPDGVIYLLVLCLIPVSGPEISLFGKIMFQVAVPDVQHVRFDVFRNNGLLQVSGSQVHLSLLQGQFNQLGIDIIKSRYISGAMEIIVTEFQIIGSRICLIHQHEHLTQIDHGQVPFELQLRIL